MINKIFLLYMFLIICFPFQIQSLKLLLIILLVSHEVLVYFDNKKYFSFSVNWYVLYFLYVLAWFSMGVLENYKIFTFYFISMIGSVLIYFIVFNIEEVMKKEILKKLEIIFIYSFFINFIFYLLMYIHYNYYSLPSLLVNCIVLVGKIIEIWRPGQYAKATASNGFLVTASFIIPYLTAKYFFEINSKFYILKLFLWDIIFGIFFILTLRKVQIIIFIMTNIFLFIIVNIWKKKNINNKMIKYFKYGTLLFCIVLLLNFKYKVFDFSNLINYVSRSFNYSAENVVYPGVFERKIQFKALMQGFFSNVQTFLIGKGIGSNVDVVRSDIPGVYELTYIAMLFQRGIIGTIIFFTFIFVFLYRYIIILNSKYISCDSKIYAVKYGLGFLGIFLASATNPAFGSVEYIWMLFINIFVISVLERNE